MNKVSDKDDLLIIIRANPLDVDRASDKLKDDLDIIITASETALKVRGDLIYLVIFQASIRIQNGIKFKYPSSEVPENLLQRLKDLAQEEKNKKIQKVHTKLQTQLSNHRPSTKKLKI